MGFKIIFFIGSPFLLKLVAISFFMQLHVHKCEAAFFLNPIAHCLHNIFTINAKQSRQKDIIETRLSRLQLKEEKAPAVERNMFCAQSLFSKQSAATHLRLFFGQNQFKKGCEAFVCAAL
jgi:hypothetical protein